MSTNYSQLHRSYENEIYGIDRKLSAKDNELYSAYCDVEKAARKVRDEARKPVDAAYNDAVTAAAEAQRKGRKESDDTYQAAVNAADKARTDALAEKRAELVEEKKAVVSKVLPEGTANADVIAWMFTAPGVWSNYSGECEIVLGWLEENKPTTLAEVNEYGRKNQRWCGTYSLLLIQAVEAGALALEYTGTELAQLKADTALANVGMNTENRQQLTSAILTVLGEAGVKDDAVTSFLESLNG